jgi:hypothetical protein
VRWLCEAAEWRELQRAGTTGLLLDQVEDAAGWVIFLSDLLGHDLQPLYGRAGADVRSVRR